MKIRQGIDQFFDVIRRGEEQIRLRNTQMWRPFAGSKLAPCRSSHRFNSMLVIE
jgi:hypothetical protein